MLNAQSQTAPQSQSKTARLEAFFADPYLYATLVLALVAILLASQFRFPFSLQVGGPVDGPLLYRFNDPENEKPARTTFRWTTGDSVMLLPDWGIGNPVQLELTVSRWQPDNAIADLTIYINGLEFNEPRAAGPGRQTYKLPIVDPQFLQTDNLAVQLVTDSFVPKDKIPGNPDPRTLGIQLYSVRLLPLQNDNGQWRAIDGLVFAPFKLPPLDLGLDVIGSALALYLGLVIFKVPRRFAFGLCAVCLLAAATGLVLLRPYLTLFATPFFYLVVLSILVGLVARGVAPRLMAWGGVHPSESELNLLALLFAFAFLLKLSFLLYPQTISYDLMYHVHRLQDVMNGQLFWSIPSGKNEFGGQDVPYLPSFYVFLSPFAEFVPLTLLVQLSGVILDSVTIFFIYYLLKKHFDDGGAGLFAAWVYILVPLAFIAISWGIYANIFGQFLTLLLVVALVEGFDRLTTTRGFVVISALFTLTLLSHTSVFASVVPLFAVWAALLFVLGRAWRDRHYWAYIGSILAASAVAFFAYYVNFVGLVTQSTAAIAASSGDTSTRNVGDAGLTFLQLLQPARTEYIAVPLYVYAAALLGFVGLIYLAWRSPTRGRFLTLTMLAAWFAALGVLMYTRAEFGFSSRYVNFAMPAIALCAGAALSWAYARGWPGRAVSLGVALLVGGEGLYHWFMLAIFKYH